MSRDNIYLIKDKLLDRVTRHFIQNPIKLGGQGIFVQIDRTTCNYSVKASRGRGRAAPTWAITNVDCGVSPAKRYSEIVSNRTAAKLESTIQWVVKPGSVVTTDEWAAYSEISSYGIMSIVHSAIDKISLT